jgi:hypothetical protein
MGLRRGYAPVLPEVKRRISRSAAEAIRQPRDRLKRQPQERSLIAGTESTAFSLLNAKILFEFI